MAREADLQAKIIKHLKKQGCIALKYPQNATTIAGVSDIFFCKEQFYGFIEVKKTRTSKRRPGQKEFVDKINEWSWAKIVWGGEDSNWPEVQRELEEILK